MKAKYLRNNNNNKVECFIKKKTSFKYCFRKREQQNYSKINLLIQQITTNESKNSKTCSRIYQNSL